MINFFKKLQVWWKNLPKTGKIKAIGAGLVVIGIVLFLAFAFFLPTIIPIIAFPIAMLGTAMCLIGGLSFIAAKAYEVYQEYTQAVAQAPKNTSTFNNILNFLSPYTFMASVLRTSAVEPVVKTESSKEADLPTYSLDNFGKIADNINQTFHGKTNSVAPTGNIQKQIFNENKERVPNNFPYF